MAGRAVARHEPLEAARADDPAGLDAAPGSGSRCGNSGWACSCAARSASARGSSPPLPSNIVTVFDFTNCYAAPPIVQPCERDRLQGGNAERRVQRLVRRAADRRRGVAAVGVVERGRAEADHRRFPEAARRLVRARLAQPAHLAVGANRRGPTASRSWAHCRPSGWDSSHPP